MRLQGAKVTRSRKQVNKLLDEIKKVLEGREIVIEGDFILTVSNWIDSDRPVSKADLAIQARLANEFGLLNCWQAANPDQPLHQTLRWTGDRATPYQCDGLFVPKSWKDRLESCVVLAGDEWNTLSDHNPVVARFRSTAGMVCVLLWACIFPTLPIGFSDESYHQPPWCLSSRP